MMKNLGMILLALALVSFACAKAITTTEADVRSDSDTEEKQGDQLKAEDKLAQNDKSDERDNVQFSNGKLEGMSKFEKVPADEERLIKDMEVLLQEKMSVSYTHL